MSVNHLKIKIEKYTLEELVFKCLVKELKDRRLYHAFRCFIGNGIVYFKPLCVENYTRIAQHTARQNPFYKTKSRYDIYRMLEATHSINISKRNNAEIQKAVSIYINDILHCCVENIVGDLSKMEEIGRSIFETTCKLIFGEDFVDETIDETTVIETPFGILTAPKEFNGDTQSLILAKIKETLENKPNWFNDVIYKNLNDFIIDDSR